MKRDTHTHTYIRIYIYLQSDALAHTVSENCDRTVDPGATRLEPLNVTPLSLMNHNIRKEEGNADWGCVVESGKRKTESRKYAPESVESDHHPVGGSRELSIILIVNSREKKLTQSKAGIIVKKNGKRRKNILINMVLLKTNA